MATPTSQLACFLSLPDLRRACESLNESLNECEDIPRSFAHSWTRPPVNFTLGPDEPSYLPTFRLSPSPIVNPVNGKWPISLPLPRQRSRSTALPEEFDPLNEPSYIPRQELSKTVGTLAQVKTTLEAWVKLGGESLSSTIRIKRRKHAPFILDVFPVMEFCAQSINEEKAITLVSTSMSMEDGVSECTTVVDDESEEDAKSVITLLPRKSILKACGTFEAEKGKENGEKRGRVVKFDLRGDSVKYIERSRGVGDCVERSFGVVASWLQCRKGLRRDWVREKLRSIRASMSSRHRRFMNHLKGRIEPHCLIRYYLL